MSTELNILLKMETTITFCNVRCRWSRCTNHLIRQPIFFLTRKAFAQRPDFSSYFTTLLPNIQITKVIKFRLGAHSTSSTSFSFNAADNGNDSVRSPIHSAFGKSPSFHPFCRACQYLSVAYKDTHPPDFNNRINCFAFKDGRFLSI